MSDRKRIIAHLRYMTFGVLCLLVWVETVQAAAVSARVDRNKIDADDAVNLVVVIKDGDGTVDVSPIKDFKVISRGSRNQIEVVNFKKSVEKQYHFALIPLKKGRLMIPSLEIVVDDEKYNTQEIMIDVVDRSGGLSSGNSGRPDVFAEAKISLQKPFRGQAIVYTFQLYQGVNIRNVKYRPPEFNGFVVTPVKTRKPTKTKIDDRPYLVSEIQYVLIPVSIGRVTIEPASLSCDIVREPQKRSRPSLDLFFERRVFGSFGLEPKSLLTSAIELAIRPLPEYKGDMPFSGLVGNFTIRAEMGKVEIAKGESSTLAVIIEGTGNMQTVPEPETQIPEEFKVYDDQPEEKISSGPEGFSGKKTFKYALVPLKTGEYVLPPVRYVFFNVDTGKYGVTMTRPIRLHVNPALDKEDPKAFSAGDAESKLKTQKEKVEFTGQDILPLKDDLDALKNHRPMTSFRFGLYMLLPVVLFGIIRFVLMLSGRKEDTARFMVRRAHLALKNAGRKGISDETFISCLYRAVVSTVFAQAGIKGESLTYREATDILRDNGCDETVTEQACELLEKIESAKYSGSRTIAVNRQDLLSATIDLIRRLR